VTPTGHIPLASANADRDRAPPTDSDQCRSAARRVAAGQVRQCRSPHHGFSTP